MTPYEKLFQEGFKHQVRLVQNRADLQKQVIRLVHATEKQWADRLIAAASQLTEVDLARLRGARFSGTARLKRFSQRLDEFVTALTEAIRKKLVPELQDLAEYEAMFWGDRYKSFLDDTPDLRAVIDLNTNTKQKSRAGVLGGVVVTGLLADQFRRYRVNRRSRLRDAVVSSVGTDGLRGLNTLFRVSDRQRARGRVIGESIRSIAGWVADTHTHAASQGAKALVEQNELLDLVWTAMMDNGRPGIDNKTSSICITRNGQLVNRDLGGLVPPAHINCLPGDALISPGVGVSGVSKRWYRGEIVVIDTSLGKKLTLTPNHPVLTKLGWVPAGEIKIGDDVVGCSMGQPDSFINPDTNNTVTRFDDFYKSFLSSSGVSAVSVPATTKDFHGDGIANSEVDIVNINSLLPDNAFNVLADKHLEQAVFISACVSGAKFSCFGSFASFLNGVISTRGSCVSFLDKALPVLRASNVHSSLLLLAAVSYVYSALNEQFSHFDGADSSTLADSVEADSRLVKTSGLINYFRGAYSISDTDGFDPGRFKSAMGCLIANANLPSNFLDGKAGFVELDNVVDIKRDKVMCHVYNLENVSGFYIAQNLYVHNCRSIVVPAVDYKAIRRSDRKKLNPETRNVLREGFPVQGSSTEQFNALSEADQRELLGPTRFKLFQEGKLSFPRDFINPRTEERYTLAEIARREGIEL